MADDRRLLLAVALDGAGWHPTAWREPSARPAELFTAGYWTDLAQLSDRARLSFLTIEDSLALQSNRRLEPDDRTDMVRGRLDAVMVAARVAPVTQQIGLVPSVTVTHTEPFHISKAIATLDYVSGGRAGVRVQISARPFEAELFGRRSIVLDGTPEAPGSQGIVEDLFEEAGDYVEVLRRLWDSWEDDAEIRDVTTGRFVDRNKLHKIDFSGRWFSVKGPSITPRPPQGQPLVAALAHSELPYRFALSRADVVFVTPADAEEAGYLVDELDRLRQTLAGPIEHTTVLADLVVFLGDTAGEAESAKARMDERLGQLYRSDAAVFVGTASALADLLEQWGERGIEGFRLRPGRLPEDLRSICEDLVPELERRSLLRGGGGGGGGGGTLRDRFGLARPVNRYARGGPR